MKQRLGIAQTASMRPRSDDRGNALGQPDARLEAVARFNEAAIR